MTTPRPNDDAVLAHLEAARARLAAGASLQGALEAVPAESREEVRSLIEVTARLEAVAAGPAPDFVARLEATLDAAARDPGARPSRWRRWRTSIGSSLALRAAFASAAAIVLVFGTGFVAVEASADALPGDALYPVKEARERVERWLARSDTARLRVQQTQLDRRTDELARAVDGARDTAVVDRLEGTIARDARALIDRALALHAEGNTNAVPRAREALLEMGRRLRARAPAARTPEQRQALLRVGAFLRAQLARLDAVTDAPRDRRLPLREAPPLERDGVTPTRTPAATLEPLPPATPTSDAPTSDSPTTRPRSDSP